MRKHQGPGKQDLNQDLSDEEFLLSDISEFPHDVSPATIPVKSRPDSFHDRAEEMDFGWGPRMYRNGSVSTTEPTSSLDGSVLPLVGDLDQELDTRETVSSDEVCPLLSWEAVQSLVVPRRTKVSGVVEFCPLEVSTRHPLDLEPDNCSVELSYCSDRLTFHRSITCDTATESVPAALRNYYRCLMADFSKKQMMFLDPGGVGIETGRTSEQNEVALGVLHLTSRVSVLTLDTMKKVHQILMKKDLSVNAGKLRRKPARRGRMVFVEPRRIEALFQDCLLAMDKLLHRDDLTLPARAGTIGFLLLRLHPFDDGNGRMGRLLVNWALVKMGMPFVVNMCSADDEWKEYTAAIREDSPTRFIRLVAMAVYYAWKDFDTVRCCPPDELTDSEHAVARRVRETAKRGSCIVCSETSPELSILCCNAAMHAKCLMRWMRAAPKNQPTCPKCQEKMCVLENCSSVTGQRRLESPRITTTTPVQEEDDVRRLFVGLDRRRSVNPLTIATAGSRDSPRYWWPTPQIPRIAIEDAGENVSEWDHAAYDDSSADFSVSDWSDSNIPHWAR